MLARVARDYRLPYRVARTWLGRREYLRAPSRRDTVPLDYRVEMRSGLATPEQWQDWYLSQLRKLGPGVTEILIHPGYDDAELQRSPGRSCMGEPRGVSGPGHGSEPGVRRRALGDRRHPGHLAAAGHPDHGMTDDRDAPLLPLALWAGIVTGLGELGKIAGDLWFSDFIMRSRDALWMVPAVDGVAFAAVGLVLVLLTRWVRVPWWLAAGLFAGLGTLLVLLLVQRLHPLAAVAVAAGVGTQAGRWVRPRVPASVRAVRRGLPWLVGAVLLAAAPPWDGGPWPSGGWRPRVPRRPPGRPVCSC